MHFTKKFYKEATGMWFIDLPEYIEMGGTQIDLAMVSGADTLLELLAQGEGEVKVKFSDVPFKGANLLNQYKMGSAEGGAYYWCETFQGIEYNFSVWLCDVTKFVFGDLPKEIYYKQITT